jgi:hypothetical protein
MYYGPTTGVGNTGAPVITSIFNGAPPRTFYTTRLLLACGLALPLPTTLTNFRCNTTVTALTDLDPNSEPPLGSQTISYQPKDRPAPIDGTQIPLRGYEIDLSHFSTTAWKYLFLNTEFEALVGLTGTYVPLPSYLNAYVFVDGIEVVITER